VSGSYYILTLGEDGVPKVSLAVSVYATDLLVAGGRIITPQLYGNEFRMVGIPADGAYGSPIPPEVAVKIASEATMARVVAPPVFVTKGVKWFPHFGHWRVELDRMVDVIPMGDGSPIRTKVVYVQRDGSLGVASTHGNGTDELLYRRDGEMRTLRISPREGMAREIVPVRILTTGGV
jgi:hypothetical protein